MAMHWLMELWIGGRRNVSSDGLWYLTSSQFAIRLKLTDVGIIQPDKMLRRWNVCAAPLHFLKGVVNLHWAPVSSPLTFLHRAIGNWNLSTIFVTTAAVPAYAPTSHCDNISSREENCVHRVLAAAVPQRWQVCCHVCVSVKYHCVNGNMSTFCLYICLSKVNAADWSVGRFDDKKKFVCPPNGT